MIFLTTGLFTIKFLISILWVVLYSYILFYILFLEKFLNEIKNEKNKKIVIEKNNENEKRSSKKEENKKELKKIKENKELIRHKFAIIIVVIIIGFLISLENSSFIYKSIVKGYPLLAETLPLNLIVFKKYINIGVFFVSLINVLFIYILNEKELKDWNLPFYVCYLFSFFIFSFFIYTLKKVSHFNVSYVILFFLFSLVFLIIEKNKTYINFIKKTMVNRKP